MVLSIILYFIDMLTAEVLVVTLQKLLDCVMKTLNHPMW